MTPQRSAALGRLGAVAAAAAGLELAGFWLYRWLAFLPGDLRGPDFFSFYAAGRLFLARGGGAVYDQVLQKTYQDQVTAQWAPLHFILLPYIHPPYVTPLLALLAMLPYRAAYTTWGLINLLLFAAALTVLVRSSMRLHGKAALPAIALAAGFFPAFVVLLQGQTDFLMVLPLAAASAAWARGRLGWAGIFTGLALIKPHLILVVPCLFIARRAWRALAGTAAVAAVLGLVALVLSGPTSIAGYLGLVTSWATGNNQAWPITGQTVYSLRGLLETMPGGRLPALAVLVVLLLLTALALSWRPDVPRLDFALALAASVALSPYQNLHDLALLVIPGFMLGDLAVAGAVRHPRLSMAVLGLAYAGITVTLFAGTQTAALGALALAGILLVERLFVGPEPIPLGEVAWSGPRPRRVIVLPAYKAARTVKEVVDGIPPGSADRILLVDDASSDATVSVATALQLDVIRHERNLGYGGNQKTCYRTALEMGADVVVMLHPDNQYDPAIVPKLCEMIERGEADIVLGSRWLGIDPGKAGMPVWKRAGNRFLTWTENHVLGLELSEFHTGYRAYSRRFLEAIPFLENSNDFVFDTQVLVQAAAFGFRIGEVPAVGRYFEEMSSIGFRTSAVYGLKTLASLLRYVFHRAGFPARWLTPRAGRISGAAIQASSFSR
jgi:hypothetical protein